jgi:hypothetical protein
MNNRALVLLTVLGLASLPWSATLRLDATAQTASVVTYAASDEDFANPERGFFVQRSYNPARGNARGLDVEEIRGVRERQMSLVRMLYSLAAYRDEAIPAGYLKQIETDFAAARQAGVKLIPRFAYNSGPIGAPDAPLERMLAHIDQLTPVLRANSDVLAFLEAGFAGAWGEWHNSTNGLFTTGTGAPPTVNERTRALAEKLLAALPVDRMIALRCPRFKTDLFGEAPLTSEDAFSGTARARTGAINDCFLASPTDSGTFTRRIADEKAFFHQDNLYVPQGGETCSTSAAAQPFIGCANTLKEMAYQRYSTLNIDYNRGVLKGWDSGGCMPEIRRRLGYRYRLVDSRAPETVHAGGALTVTISVVNNGFANLYNPRPLEVVLRHRASGQIHRLRTAEDPRRWLPGEPHTVEFTGGIPAGVAPGAYDVLLHLPDAGAALQGRPEFAVRFANEDVWEPATGMNSLRRHVRIEPATANSAKYTGERWFR